MKADIAMDRLASKEAHARQCGATHFVDASACYAVAAIRDITRGGAETAFKAVGDECDSTAAKWRGK